MKKKIILFYALFIFGASFAQVGVGNTNPKVNLDARAVTGNSAIAFGNTNQTAPDAGGGAMKYDTGSLYYSNGTTWVPLLEKLPNVFIPRVVASAKKNAIQTDGPTNTNETHIWNFEDITINDGNWDSTANGYTVPVTGFYQMSLFGNISVNAANNSTSWTIFVYTGAVESRYIVATYTNIPALGSYSTGGTLTLYLTAGQVVKLGTAYCNGCGSAKTYTVSPGALFTITQLSN
ncbi:hypothetical protein F3J23_09760 [Chryseobacterium sp. Tr-659]|uniref:hypothetical protein n=2 Tax=Pseudomonadati TaxID=3379134 RepID=UPI001420BD50|nr:hypothetical protein [Chryseobacterium sp. Tr-659]NIF05731.1 hypothetical protein [Chryseobacterium sp. Tr-659]